LLVPCWLQEADRRRLEEIVSGLVDRRSPFVFVSPNNGPPTDVWLLGRVSGQTYRVSNLGSFAGMTVIGFFPRGQTAWNDGRTRWSRILARSAKKKIPPST
jgi:hypothetical protein